MNRFQRAREMAGFTQKELSVKIGVKPPIISRYEDEGASQIVPPLSRVRAIADVCGVSMSFLTDDGDLHYLDTEQAERFREEIIGYSEGLKHWPRETEASYGTTHPFLYMLKDRWAPTVEDVEYIERKFGIPGQYILNRIVVDTVEADKQISEYNKKTAVEKKTYATASKLLEYFWSRNNDSIGYAEAEALISDGALIIEENGENELYLNMTDVDYDIFDSVRKIVKKNRHKPSGSVSNKKEPSQDPEGPETADSNIQK